MMRSIVREELTRLVPAMAGSSVVFGPGSICIYAQTLDDRTIEQAGEKIFKAIKGKLRIGWGF
jgi:hypothetical protein